MGRVAQLIPTHDRSKDRWYVSVPPKLSSTGQRSREYYSTQKEAERRATQLRRFEDRSMALARKAGPELIEVAVTYEEFFQLYGLGGLREACERLVGDLEKENKTARFRALLDGYEADRWEDWGKSSQTVWRWLRAHLNSVEDSNVTSLDTEFWATWMRDVAKRENWNAGTFNNVTARLSSVWKRAVLHGVVERNPLDGVTRRKRKRVAVHVLEVEEVRALMETAWKFDREMVPYFAVALFAGLRPKSELLKLRWEDVNFEEGWIRVQFGNKTDTKRFVPMEDNLQAWLAPWRAARGSIISTNVDKRRRYIIRGKYAAEKGAPPDQWEAIVEWGRDVTRHTYGSYLEARTKDRNVVKENMGHSDFATYQQYYRNARTPKEAADYWAIRPPG